MSRLYSLLQHKFHPPKDSTTKFTNKTIIVTGSNTGLGYEAARKFVFLGAKLVILAVRNIPKGEQARLTIEKQFDRCNRRKKADIGKIEVWPLDMNDYVSIREFVKRADEQLDRLDVVVLNAGVYMAAFQHSRYGWEETLQVNLLSTALLGIMLLQVLRMKRHKADRSDSRGDDRGIPVLEIVSSGTHERASIDSEGRVTSILESLNAEEKYIPRNQYAVSKLLVMFIMKTLASYASTTSDSAVPSFTTPYSRPTSATALIPPATPSTTTATTKPSVLVLSVCPGLCASSLFRGHNSVLVRIIRPILFALFLRTTEQGARTLVSGAALSTPTPTSGSQSRSLCSPLNANIQESHGGFWQHDIIKSPAPILNGPQSEELRSRIWNEVVEALAKDVDEVRDIVKELEEGQG